ncbi:MAG: PTS sugar transporter subunit IIA [Candidatus Omnitrophica bacterium]|nr:PTS sugar transporter subunit IIA [Candidatus Omnitrophota bacterium]
MKLSSLLDANLIKLSLSAKTKEDALRELVDLVCSHKKNLDRNLIGRAISEREEQQSTYMGKSFALPHARIEGLNDILIIYGYAREGITYTKAGDKVKYFVMLLSCKTKVNTLLQTMGAFSSVFSNDELVIRLATARSAQEFIDIINKENVPVKETVVARDLMHKDIVTLAPTDTLKEIVDRFFSHNISGAPVLAEDGTMLGVITEKEILRIGVPKYMNMMENIAFLKEYEPFEELFAKEDELLARDIMSKDFFMVHEQVSVIQLAFNFVNKNLRRLFVLDDDKKLKGMIMRKDLIQKVIRV